MFSEADFLYSMLVMPRDLLEVVDDVEKARLCCSKGFVEGDEVEAVMGRTIRSNSSTPISHAPVGIVWEMQENWGFLTYFFKLFLNVEFF